MKKKLDFLNKLEMVTEFLGKMQMRIAAYLFFMSMLLSTVYAEDISIAEIENSLEAKSNHECLGDNCPSKEIADKLVSNNTKNSVLQPMIMAKIVVLNKITAKSQEVKLALGEVKFFGNLSIEIHKCIKNTSLYNNYSLMLMSIFDNKLDDDKLLVFHGWIVSQYPSLSTLEHPVYEVIGKDCL